MKGPFPRRNDPQSPRARVRRLILCTALLVAAALLLPFPLFAAADLALRPARAAPLADQLSAEGQNCQAARELYCWQRTWQEANRQSLTAVAPENSDTAYRAIRAALKALSKAEVLSPALSDALNEITADRTACLLGITSAADETGQTTYFLSLTGTCQLSLTQTSGGIPVSLSATLPEECELDPDTAADAYAAFLGGEALTDWEPLNLTLYTDNCAARYSESGRLYLCVMQDGTYLSIAAASMGPEDVAEMRVEN